MAKNGSDLELELSKAEERVKSLKAQKRIHDEKLHSVLGKAIKAHMDQEPSFNGQVMEILDGAVTGRRDRQLVGLGERTTTQAVE